jgi:Arc/MetJ family transcription regulator
MRCILAPVSRTNIDIDDGLVEAAMARYHLRTKREAVDYALRHLVGQPLTKEEALAMCGSMPEFEVPEARFPDDRDHDDDPAR